MSLLALVLQIACLVGAIIAEDKIVPQLKEKRKWICRLNLSLLTDCTDSHTANYYATYIPCKFRALYKVNSHKSMGMIFDCVESGKDD